MEAGWKKGESMRVLASPKILYGWPGLHAPPTLWVVTFPRAPEWPPSTPPSSHQCPRAPPLKLQDLLEHLPGAGQETTCLRLHRAFSGSGQRTRASGGGEIRQLM